MLKRLACLSLIVVFCSSAAQAAEGFSISLGVGYGVMNLNEGELSSSLGSLNPPIQDQHLLTDELSNGLAVRFAMAYNIRGYASIELGMTGHGWNLDNADALGGSGHATLTAHFHPFQLFMPDRRFDASVFLGGGYSILGGGQEADSLSRGLDGGAIETGLTGRFFITKWFSVGGECRFTIPIYSKWHVDWEDSVDFELPSSPGALFFSMLFTTTFHFKAG